MAQEQLTTTTGSGTQTATQTPQAAGTSGASTAAASGVQPGTATSLLNNTQGGIALKDSPLSIVGLGQQTQSQATQTVPHSARHTSPVLFGFSIILFAVAIAMFWATARSAKTTT